MTMIYGHPVGATIAAIQNADSYAATDDSVQHLWVSLPDTVETGATTTTARAEDEDLQAWADRVTALGDGAGGWVAPAATAAAPPVLSPMLFYLAFTPTERLAIKASTDPMVVEFWATYQLAAQTNHPIDMGLVSVVEGVTYLSTTTPPLVAPARVAEILAGTPQ